MPFIGNIGAPELIIVLVIALLVLGPGKLPEVGSALGKTIRELRSATSDVKDAVSLEAPAPVPTTPATTTASPAPPSGQEPHAS